MIVYCAGAIKGDTTYQNNYIEMIRFIESMNHTALTELNGKFNASIPLSDKQIYTRDIKWIEGSVLMIAEISGPSLGVGFEIAYALFQKEIPVLALASSEAAKISAMITGCNSELLTVKKYQNIEDMQNIILDYLKNWEQESDGKGIHLSIHKQAL
jgi:2'-deoxynucleoside 5'-phosphate N-hydrolase